MELLRDNIPMVSLAVSAAALYAGAASTRLHPGLPRFAALLPVIAFFAVVPLAFSSSILRFITGFFLGWLGTFKVVLLAAGRGPLDPALPVLPFLFTALFPVKLLKRHDNGRPPPAAGASALSRAAEIAVFAAVLHAYQYMDSLHRYVRYSVYCLHLYCLLDLLIPCTAAAGRLLGLELERQFDRPYLAASLREFWGRRWNLMVSAILRASVYDPVRARAGKEAAAAASFLVSGLMHEAMACYLLLRPPTGEMVAFFLLHCAFCLVEDVLARRWKASGWPPLPRPVSFVVLASFMAATMFWLFLPPICRDGGEEMLREEWAKVPAFFLGAAQKLLQYVCFKLT
jgi:hypothetical protein